MFKPANLLMMVVASCFVAGCAAPSVDFQPRASVPHVYKVIVKDVNGKPLPSVKVTGNISGLYNPEKKEVSCTTDGEGTCPDFMYETMTDSKSRYYFSYSSYAKFEAEKTPYYAKKINSSSDYGSSGASSKDPVKTVNVILLKSTDYLKDDFLASSAEKELRERVLTFLAYFQVQSILTDTSLVLKGIGPIDFKGKKYLQIKLNSDSVYNTLKLNNYAIGTKVFDEVVRKMIDPLNGAVKASKTNYGYDIVVIGHSKDFSEKYAVAKNLEYRFLIPEAVARRYKDKDISGQELLNNSIVLLDDERIDLKLQ